MQFVFTTIKIHMWMNHGKVTINIYCVYIDLHFIGLINIIALASTWAISEGSHPTQIRFPKGFHVLRSEK